MCIVQLDVAVIFNVIICDAEDWPSIVDLYQSVVSFVTPALVNISESASSHNNSPTIFHVNGLKEVPV